jgi:bacillolysin
MKSRRVQVFIGIVALAAFTMFIPNAVIAQGVGVVVSQPSYKSSPQLTVFNEPVPAGNLEKLLKEHFKLSVQESFVLISSESDELGYIHEKFQLYYKNLKVEGSTTTAHVKNGMLYRISSNFMSTGNLSTDPAISAIQGLDFAKQHVGAKSYAWEQSEDYDEPTGELMVFTDDYTKTSYLVYKYEIYSFDPLYKADVYVNAKNGEVVFENSLIHHTNVPASGASLYDGTVNFTADQTGTNAYRLRQTSTGNGIETYSSNNQFDYTYGSAVDVTSTSNLVWPSSTKAAVQAHYGAEQTHGYFLTKHARNSFDNLGSVIKSYVNFGVGYNNAFWDGVRMTYGDGDGVVWGPLVSLDIVGHEIAHGVTTYSAGLFYRRESGALNESFSDIFGEAVENYGKSTNNWQMGTEIGIGGSGALRSMDNPNLFNDPDTYGGDFWWNVNCTSPSRSNDYCGVHHNSGVQNKWFYILTVGESGTNDIGNSYSVTGIGMDKAAAIAYRNLTVYLTTTSTFADARAGAIASAEDLYGVGSAEAIATAEAWYAVGVGATGTASSCANTIVNSAAPTNFGYYGFVFDIDATNNITIEDFKVSYYSSMASTPCTDIVDVYTRTGTYVGNTGSLTGWTLVGSTSLQSAAVGALIPLNLGANIAVAAGQTQAFMLVQRGGSTNCGMLCTLNGLCKYQYRSYLGLSKMDR